jgi:DNA-binding CsgD family transcriptional regulator
VQSHRSRHNAISHRSRRGQCGVLLVGFGRKTEDNPTPERMDGNLMRVVGQSSNLLGALNRLGSEAIEMVLLDSRYSEEELALFVRDARRRGFRGMVFHAAASLPRTLQIHPLSESAANSESSRVRTGENPEPAPSLRSLISLTGREEAVLVRVSAGWTNRQIANDLNCSVGAVKGIIQQLFGKLGVRKRAQIVRIALESGLRTSSSSTAPP